MWLICEHGAFSVVKDAKSKSDRLLVRARNADHLLRIRRAYAPLRRYRVLTTPDADYVARMFVPRQVWADVVRNTVLRQDYGNFKSRIGQCFADDPRFVTAIHDVWAVLKRYQDGTGIASTP